jgi:D-alanyl-lipoteichoic acid acyltransferase DltB (MBOAT superfamily)
MIAYLLDVDKGKIEPVKDWITFFSYVSFFPCLIAGPIDRPGLMIPQLQNKRIFNYNETSDGLKQILWGIFKKMVIADNCASLTDYIFGSPETMSASTLIAGAFFYTIQIYADFSGYSDMAIGVARLIGFNITKNFDGPFFAQNIAEFWRKWHMSLTSWMTEYLFTPLNIAFRNLEQPGLILAILVNFTIIGIWHGANWTFIIFGFLHGCYFIPLIIKGSMNKRYKVKDRLFPTWLEMAKMTFNFLLVMFTFIFFRSPSLKEAFRYYAHIFSSTIFSIPEFGDQKNIGMLIFFIILMLSSEWFQREKRHPLQLGSEVEKKNTWLSKPVRWSVYLVIVFLILSFAGREQDFIYLKF